MAEAKNTILIGIAGGTGSGKTTFIKAIIISFLANNPNNNCCIIDGKNAFLAQSGRFANIPTATTAEETLNLLDDAIIEMEKNSDLIRMEMNIVEFPIFSRSNNLKTNQIKKYYFSNNNIEVLHLLL